jgi:CDP-diacylglycerol---serine O-phosphatidyltransferase
MSLKRHIPNILTGFNLLSGLISITMVLQGSFVLASVFIFIAAVFDYLDGTAARLLDARSELGKQLDSLADVVSFGVAPGIIMFQLLFLPCSGSCNILERLHVTPYIALLIPICSALRLAKFNIDSRQAETFIGLPTPANAIFFASIPLVLFLQPHLFSMIRLEFMFDFFSNTRILVMLAVFFSYLMISDFRIFSMKFKSTAWKGNEARYILLLLSLLMVIFFSLSAIPLIILAYLLLSMVFQKKIEL